MVIVKLMGGIGNQMFQYAAARSLALSLKTALKIDITYFSSQASIFSPDTARTYQLGHLNILEHFATSDEIARMRGLTGGALKRFAVRFVRRITRHTSGCVFRETGFAFDPRLLHIEGDVYLEGYWQSEKYFMGISELIQNEFSMKEPFSDLSAAMAGLISNTESVSIHIRRGDYVTSPQTSRLHGLCSVEYYSRAVAKICELVTKPHFFVFSDDPHWGRENLELGHPTTFVTHNGPLRDYEDLHLIALCKHHIIANSSFSWWGAWLSSSPNKLICTPRRWFNDPTVDTQDAIPASWMRI